MSSFTIPGAQVEGGDANGVEFVIPSSTMRRLPWMLVLPAGDQLCLWYDFSIQAILCRRVAWNGTGYDKSPVVTVVSGTPLTSLCSFGNAQKVLTAFLDTDGRVRFARSFDQSDTWEIDQSDG